MVLLPSALKMEPYIVLERRTQSLPLGNVTFLKDQNLGVLPAGSLCACTCVQIYSVEKIHFIDGT